MSQTRKSAKDAGENTDENTDWELFEVFVRAKNGLSHKHVGSVHAADSTMAVGAARDLYTRRGEGESLWVVASKDITASDPDNADVLFAPAKDKIYRHPTFYEITKEVKNM